MKVQVDYVFESKAQPDQHSLQFVLSPSESALDLKNRILAVKPTPFEQALLFNGRPLSDNTRLADCGVHDGSQLQFVVEASETSFAQQLEELLQDRSLSAQELSLLYSHKHGASVKEVLASLGFAGQPLRDFVTSTSASKRIVIGSNGLLSLSGSPKRSDELKINQRMSSIIEEPSPQTDEAEAFPVSVEVVISNEFGSVESSSLDLKVTTADATSSLKERVAQASISPFPVKDLFHNKKAMEDQQKLSAYSVKPDSTLRAVVVASTLTFLAQLALLLEGKPLSVNQLSDKYCCRFGVPVSRALKLLGLNLKLQDFLKCRSGFEMREGLVTLSPNWRESGSADNGRYLRLHERLLNNARTTEVKQLLELVVEAASQSFLQVRRVCRGPSKGSGVDAEAVLLLDGLPPCGQGKWLPPLLQTLAASLRVALDKPEEKDILVANESVLIAVAGAAGCVSVALRLAPFSSDALNAFKKLQREAPPGLGSIYVDHYLESLFAEKRDRFFKRLPEAAQSTMRLLRWWREQQPWSSVRTRPSDELLELVAAHAVLTSSATLDLSSAIHMTMSMLGNFSQLKLTWPNDICFYSQEEIPEEVAESKPLVLDPANPFRNLADEKDFDPSEMMALARNPGFVLPQEVLTK